MSKPQTTQERLRMDAMALVNQILDLTELDVKKRQSINDQCDDIVAEALLQARLDENRKWSEGELSLYGEDLDILNYTDVQGVIKAIADLHIAHLKGEESTVPF